MLAQNLKTPAALGISDVEFESLVKVMGMLEREEIDGKKLDMKNFRHECETIGCICGWAYFVSNGAAFPEVGNTKHHRITPLQERLPANLNRLFMINDDVVSRAATPAQAAIALRNYLTHGEPRWAEALENV